VQITSVPSGAKVFVDDRAVGNTPYTVQMDYGSHTVRVEKPGYHSGARAIDVASASLAVPFELAPVVVTGEVHIFGTPGHILRVDGEEIGKIPATAKLSEGTHRFEVTDPATGRSLSSSRDIRFEAAGRAITVTLGSP
jgi:hypothetical protein